MSQHSNQNAFLSAVERCGTPGATIIGCGLISLGIAAFGMAQCEARSAEARASAEVENAKDRIDFYKWQLENEIMTSEQWAELNKSPLEKIMEKKSENN